MNKNSLKKCENKKPHSSRGLVGLALTVLMIVSPFMLIGCSRGQDEKNGDSGTIWKSGVSYTEFDDAKIGDYYIDIDDYILYQKTATDWAVVMENYGKPGSTPIAPEAPVITINQDGYWMIDGVVTETKAKGENGQPGSTPIIEIKDGFWYINNVKSIKAEATDGHTPVITIDSHGYWVIDETSTQTKATPATITISEGYWYIDGVTTGVKAAGKDGATWGCGKKALTELNEAHFGNNGDFYLNTTTYDIFNKDNNVWTKIGNIKGQDGTDGQNGADATEQISAWNGKTAVFVGDSITYGSGCNGKKYWELLEEQLGFSQVIGMGIGKSCISKKSENGSQYSPLISRYNDIPQADLIQIFMGTNDYAFNTPLGTIEDTTDVSFYGALNVIIPALQAKYPTSRIVMCTPLHRYGLHGLTYDYLDNKVGASLNDYVNAIKEVCERYSVPVIDLFSISGINPTIESMKTTYMPDGLHPNSNGHKLMADLMSNYLELYSLYDNTHETIKGLDEISLVRASIYYPSLSDSCRLSSAYNVYLKAGQKISLIDNDNYKYFLYAQVGTTPTVVASGDRLDIMNTWTTNSFTATYSGWYGVTMAKTDMSEFDEDTILSQTLSDYIIIE